MNTTLSNSTFSCLEPSQLLVFSKLPACCLSLLVSFPINSFIVWLVVSGAAGTMATEFCTLNFAVNELLICLDCLLNFLPIRSHMFPTGDLFFQVFINICRLLFQTMIALERYLAVLHPMIFLRCKPLRYRVAFFSVLWMLSIGLYLPTILVSGGQALETILISFYASLYLLMCFCFVSVLRALRQPAPGDSERQTKRDSGNSMKRKAFNITLTNMLLLTSYIPFFATSSEFHHYNQTQCFLALCLVSMIETLTSLIHPLLYLKRQRKLPCLRKEK